MELVIKTFCTRAIYFICTICLNRTIVVVLHATIKLIYVARDKDEQLSKAIVFSELINNNYSEFHLFVTFIDLSSYKLNEYNNYNNA